MALNFSWSRTLAALILLGVATAGLASLGNWQLRRAQERRAIGLAIEAGRQAAALELSPTTAQKALQPWRAARAHGVWRNDLTVLIDNRNLGARPGLWVATPLQGTDGTALLVLRGWLPRPLGDAPLSVPSGKPGIQQVRGELASRVPRLFELPGQAAGLPHDWPGSHDMLPRVQNLDTAALAHASGLDFLPVVLLQTAATQNDGLLRDWPQPSTNAEQNIGYALQWFGFAAITAIAWIVVATRALRSALRHRSDNKPLL